MANEFDSIAQNAKLLMEARALDVAALCPILQHVSVIPLTGTDTSYTMRELVRSSMWSSGNDGDPTASDIASIASTTTPISFERKESFKLSDVRNNPDLIGNAAQKFGEGWSLTIDAALLAAYIGADAATHPANGKTYVAAQGGGTVYYADAITVDPVNGGSNFNQTNIYSAALGDSTLVAMLVARQNARWFSGERAERPPGKAVMMANTSAMMDAESMIQRQVEIYDGSGLRTGGFSSRIAGLVTIDSAITTDTVWGLFWTDMLSVNGGMYNVGPITPVTRAPLTIRVEASTERNIVNVLGEGAFSLLYSPRQYNLQLSKV